MPRIVFSQAFKKLNIIYKIILEKMDQFFASKWAGAAPANGRSRVCKILELHA